MVRKAIDAYNPDAPEDMEENELLDLVSMKVKEACSGGQESELPASIYI